jgi:uncharacterized membrane protein
MAFCANCGSQVEGRFCAKCGAGVGEGSLAGSSVPPVGVPPAGGGSQPAMASTGMSDNVASALSYVLGFVTGILFLVLAPYNQNKTVRFHAFQSIFLSVAWFVVWFAFNIVLGIMHLAGLFFILFLSPLIGLAFFVLWIYMIVTAYQGKQVVLPVIGPIAKQQA